jgi:[ribosomal protein S5]-alanine N-acetyltransferase
VAPSRLRRERPWQEHALLYRDLFTDPAVATVLWPREPQERADERAQEVLRRDIEHWQSFSFGPWVFFELATGMFVGRGGLRRSVIAGSECVEVLYALRPDVWGRGYATEIALVSVQHAQELRISEVVGLAAVSNRASRRVLEKAGLAPREPVEHVGLPHLLGRLRTLH